MRINKAIIDQHNEVNHKVHRQKFDFIKDQLYNTEVLIQKLIDFNVAIPSWALGTGGTRFARFSGAGEPATLQDKMEDVGLIHAINNSSALYRYIFLGISLQIIMRLNS
jgi:L-rhamnose isomerase/sugar isomerase